ncbi:MAG: hypothetical protein O7C56_04535, partial [Rickettsia endosymbiont of Ixodes persulcatus]|nr:hypothetical protein [Rickettsia endosymbiont of Ixodes persulcatus]
SGGSLRHRETATAGGGRKSLLSAGRAENTIHKIFATVNRVPSYTIACAEWRHLGNFTARPFFFFFFHSWCGRAILARRPLCFQTRLLCPHRVWALRNRSISFLKRSHCVCAVLKAATARVEDQGRVSARVYTAGFCALILREAGFFFFFFSFFFFFF